MINIKFNEETFSIRNSINEIRICEFEDICELTIKYKDDEIDKWIEIFKYLGLPQNICDNLDISDVLKLSSFFQFIRCEIPLKKIRKEIKILDKKYKFVNSNGKINIKNLIDIENYTQRNKVKYIAEMISILYPTDDNNKKHIQNIRENLTMENVIPIINYLNKEFFHGK
jgi:hypothetical protein